MERVVEEFLDRCIDWVEDGEDEIGGGDGLVEYRRTGPLYLLRMVSDELHSDNGDDPIEDEGEFAVSVEDNDLPVVTGVLSYIGDGDNGLPVVTSVYSFA